MVRILALVGCVLVAATIRVAAATDELTAAADTFLEALSEAERDETTWPFADAEREDIHYAPLGLDGLRHGDLAPRAHGAGEDVLRSVLSERGQEQVRAIRLLERDVRAQESVLMRVTGMRDPGRYFWAFFGAPSANEPWGFRYEGHHLSMNVTVAGEQVATTPLFLGAQPRVAPPGSPSEGTAALGEEEHLARALYASLEGKHRAAATLEYRNDRGHMIGQVPRLDAPEPIGVASADMTAAQRALLHALLDRFAAFWAGDIAQARRADIEIARPALHFAHVEADQPPNAFYTRISGPGLLIEIDNTEGGDHVHAVWHRPGADFGRDLLAGHLADDHGIRLVRRDRHVAPGGAQ
jgi:hypothetical protein